jgi:hypothetical protein
LVFNPSKREVEKSKNREVNKLIWSLKGRLPHIEATFFGDRGGG